MPVTVPVPKSTEPAARLRGVPEIINENSSFDILMLHVGPDERDPLGFLPCLRRGQPVSETRAAELIEALNRLEEEHRGAVMLDRRLAHALHRLALESQVLLTDAWPGVFDERVVLLIRSVQEAVERILSGQDIRYYPTPLSGPTAERLP
jgi:hypothetical protein